MRSYLIPDQMSTALLLLTSKGLKLLSSAPGNARLGVRLKEDKLRQLSRTPTSRYGAVMPGLRKNRRESFNEWYLQLPGSPIMVAAQD